MGGGADICGGHGVDCGGSVVLVVMAGVFFFKVFFFLFIFI